MGGQFAFLLPTMLATVGCAFLVLWRYRIRSALPWGIGFVSAAIAFTVPVWPEIVPGIVRGIAANTLFAIAFFAYGRGLIGKADRGVVLHVRASALAAAILLGIITVSTGNQFAEVLTNDLCCAVMLGTALVAMRRRLGNPARRVLFGVASLVVLETVLRMAIGLMTPQGPATASFLDTPYAYLMQVGAGVLGLFFALAAVGAVLFDATAGYRRDALTDSLTGLLNRRGFGETIDRLPGGERQTGAVIACDIDYFKRVNDRYGHPTGDAVIVRLADVIRQGIPARAIARRSGGEEFTIFLPGADAGDATRLANALRTAFSESPWSAHGIEERLTVSFGVALLDASEWSLEEAIARADQALYEAKRNGRDRVFYRLQVIANDEKAASA